MCRDGGFSSRATYSPNVFVPLIVLTRRVRGVGRRGGGCYCVCIRFHWAAAPFLRAAYPPIPPPPHLPLQPPAPSPVPLINTHTRIHLRHAHTHTHTHTTHTHTHTHTHTLTRHRHHRPRNNLYSAAVGCLNVCSSTKHFFPSSVLCPD